MTDYHQAISVTLSDKDGVNLLKLDLPVEVVELDGESLVSLSPKGTELPDGIPAGSSLHVTLKLSDPELRERVRQIFDREPG